MSSTSEDSIEDLVRSLTAVDVPPASSNRLATVWLGHAPRAMAKALFDLLRAHPSPDVADRALAVVAELVRRSDQWEKLIRASVSKRGRCPKPLRKALRGVLDRARTDAGTAEFEPTDEPLLPPPESIPPVRRPRATRATPPSHLLEFDTNCTRIEQVPSVLLPRLSGLRPRRDRVTIDFRDADHFFVPGLVVLATWLEARRYSADFRNRSDRSEPYLREIGLTRAAGFTVVDSTNRPDANLPIRALEARGDADVVAGRLVRIFDAHAGLMRPQDRSALVVTFAELIENVVRHAGAAATSRIAAQFYPARQKVSITIADTGIGIRRSFAAGRNEAAKREIRDDASALEVALRPRVTSKPVVPGEALAHAGYGLYITSELAVRNGGTFLITSGSASLCRFRQGWRRRSWTMEHPPWEGTIVSLLLDLCSPLPLHDVYRELPPPRGFEEADFFA